MRNIKGQVAPNLRSCYKALTGFIKC